jgi:hypothetical protein
VQISVDTEEEEEIMESNYQSSSSSQVISMNGNDYIKNNDGSLSKLSNEEYDDSNLIYR